MSFQFATAKEILLINPSSPTGGQAIYSKEIINELKQHGYEVDLKTTNGNCALAKNLWDNSRIPTMLITATNTNGNAQKEENICFIETTKQNFLYWINSNVNSFCSAGNKTWQDFIKKGSTHTIVVPADSKVENFVKELAKLYEVNIRVVRVMLYNEAITMVKAGEVDYLFRTGIHVTPELKDKCFWNNLQIDEKNLFPKLSHLKTTYNKIGEEMFFMQKGFDMKDIDNLRLHIRNTIRNSIEIQKQIERRGQTVFDWNSKDDFDKLTNKFFEAY